MDEHEESDFEPAHHAKNPKRDPLAGPLWVDFDWPALYERLGEAEPRDAAADVRQVQADYLREILVWITAPRRLRGVGMRVLMVAHHINAKMLSRAQLKALRSHRWSERRKARRK